MKNNKEKKCAKKENGRILILTHEAMLNQIQADKESLETGLQEVVDSFAKMDLGLIENTANLQMAVTNPLALFNARIDALIPVPEQQGRFKLNKDAYLQTLELPDNREFVRAANSLVSRLPHFTVSLSMFNIDTVGQIQIDPDEYKKAIDSASVFAETDDELEVYNLVMAAAKALQKLTNFSERVYSQPMITGMYKQVIDTAKFFKIDVSNDQPIIKVNPAYFAAIKAQA